MSLIALLLLAAPGWASKPDTADEKGHTFVCEGQGATEEEAQSAAQAICNDKICKVCGVEVESIVETKETLQGVDFQRKVVERCRRVRKADTKVLRKSTDCDSGCTAWIEIFYSREDEKAECSSYTKEDFADPAACEKDIQEFRAVEGRTAESFRARTKALDASLVHCAKIDVRPTPAMLALDEKLKAGLSSFEWSSSMQERTSDEWQKPAWAFYLPADASLHSHIAESKSLLERFRLARDYVANKALVFELIEAAQARDLDSPAGLDKLRAAMEKAPTGRQYGVPYDAHFGALSAVYRFKSDTGAVGETMRKLYAPASLEGGDDFTAAKFFADDGKCTQAEWDWQWLAAQKRSCPHCLRTLIAAPDHGDLETRIQRTLAALDLTAKAAHGDKRELNALKQIAPLADPAFLLALEKRLPEPFQRAFGWAFLREALGRLDEKKHPAEVRAQFASRAAVALAADFPPGDARNWCTGLAGDLAPLVKQGARLEPLDARACSCLTGVLRNETSLVNRSDLLDLARKRGLACTKGLPE